MYGDDAKTGPAMCRIPVRRLVDLLFAAEKLERLEAAGVANWEGFTAALSGQDGGETYDDYVRRVEDEFRDILPPRKYA